MSIIFPKPAGIDIALTDAEIAICRVIGNLRMMVDIGFGIKDRKMGNQSGIDLSEDGVIGEFAFCKHFNVFFDASTAPRSGSYDCVYRGHRFDIKTTRYREGRLLATLKKNPDIDIYALAILLGNTITLVGWVKTEDFIRDENIMNLGHGDTYAMSQKDLQPFLN